MNKSAEMTKMGGIFASICAAALLDVVTAHAERITEADLLNGVLPSTTLTVSGGSVNGQYGGSYQSALGENDAQRVVFYLSKVEEGDGCCINFTLSEKSLFNTYALRVAHSGQYDTVKRGPKKWEVYGSTDNDNWVLLSSEENQTGWQFADNGGGYEYGQAASPGETRLYRFTANGKYKYIRFRFYENNGDGSYIIVTRIVLYTATAPSTGATAETFADCEKLWTEMASQLSPYINDRAKRWGGNWNYSSWQNDLDYRLWRMQHRSEYFMQQVVKAFGLEGI